MTTSPSDRAPAGGLVTDIAVVGAGPAGLAAAVAAADAGVRVSLVDAEPAVGGQFWRHPAAGTAEMPGAVRDTEVAGLHHDLRRYRRLRRRLGGHVAAGALTHLAGHEVWAVEPQPADGAGASRFAVHTVSGAPGQRTETTVHARSLVLATGAYDLQLPFPGWDLPGVMTAGGVQSLLKGHAVLAGRRVVVAGTGPFLLSVSAGLARSGARVRGVFEAASPAGWLRRPRALLAAGSKLVEGAGYARDLARHRVGYHPGWTVLRADGDRRLVSVTVAPVDSAGQPVVGRSRTIDTDVLAVGWGFVPQLELPLALGCGTAPDGTGLPVVLVDADQRSTVPGVFAAGEICGVGGAALAVVEGEIAGAAAAAELLPPAGSAEPAGSTGGVTDPARRRPGRRRAALRSFADALAGVYPVPRTWLGTLADETVVCRCEEVTAGAIRAAAHGGGTDARTAKLLVRPGMGWCQGRICGYPTACLTGTAGTVGTTGDEAARREPGGAGPVAPGPARAPVVVEPVARPIAAPIPLGMLGREEQHRDTER